MLLLVNPLSRQSHAIFTIFVPVNHIIVHLRYLILIFLLKNVTGYSPVKGKTQMVGADAVVIYYTPHERKKFHADDYYMTAKSQVLNLNECITQF